MELLQAVANPMFRVIADLHAAYGAGVDVVIEAERDDSRHVTLMTGPPGDIRKGTLLGVTVWSDGEVWATPIRWDDAPSSNPALMAPSETDHAGRVAGALELVRVFLHQFGHGAR